MQTAIVARRADLLETLSAEIVAAGRQAPEIIVQDVMDEDSAERLRDASLRALGRVDILINCAGGSRPLPVDAPDERWVEAMTLNFTRVRQLTHALLPWMIENHLGRIVNITGKSEPEGLNAAFSAKAAVHAWAKGLSREVGQHGITINSIPPGRIMSEQIRRNYTPEYRERARCRRNSRRPLRRAGGAGVPGRLPRVAGRPLHHRHRDAGGRRPQALFVLGRRQLPCRTSGATVTGVVRRHRLYPARNVNYLVTLRSRG